MSKPAISIIDYGAGNMFSVARALDYTHIDYEFVNSAESILSAKRLLLPGVGAFSDAMKVLSNRQLVEPIKEFTKQQKPILGICLGMQLLFDYSDEHGYTRGLGLIAGTVKEIPAYGANLQKHKIPHIGWKAIEQPEYSLNNPLFNSIASEDEFYFIHSFQAHPHEENNILAHCDYNGLKICAAVQNDNLYGVQFHPEKSRQNGLSLLSNFINNT